MDKYSFMNHVNNNEKDNNNLLLNLEIYGSSLNDL